MTIFGMINTRASERYTPVALASFLNTTTLGANDLFFLIDNDASWQTALPTPAFRLLTNAQPLSFAENVNQLIPHALREKAALVFLNNDLVLTEGWLELLMAAPPGIASPLCNQQIHYHTNNFALQQTMVLEDYLGHEAQLTQIVRHHRTQMHGLRRVLSLPFFCVRLSTEVLEALGALDCSFGRGGAEDNDYCLRAALSNFPIHYVLSAFVLHFSGKSTWAGAEDKAATDLRVACYRQRFIEKWGAKLTQLLIDLDDAPLRNPTCANLLAKGDLSGLIGELLQAADSKIPIQKLELNC